MGHFCWSQFFLLMLLPALPIAAAGPGSRAAVDFNREVRPILSENCYPCHGPDSEKRKAGLRLDREGDALAELKSGERAIVPGDSSRSELIKRITTSDEDDRMPPSKTGKRLTPAQVEVLRRWIAGGAQWQKHWSFIAPARPEAPRPANGRWPRNPVDQFVLAQLERERLSPAKEATRTALIRRVTIDLTGLPPTLAEVDGFMADERPDAYERVVDRLLASPGYGEQMARHWLDAARYGDTHGLHLDNERSLWPYRDWVVAAFNRNLAFDQFTIEQLAGDLLPGKTQEQQVATGFNRCNVSTSEGGAIDEEFQVRYAVDRTETTATVWLGLTAGCAVCHDHKYDPISQKEFYQLYAFFNNVTEKAMDGNALLPPPVVQVPSDEQKARRAELDTKLAPLEARIREEVAKISYEEPPMPPPATNASDFVWLDDDFPKGAKASAAGAPVQWIEATNAFRGHRALRRTDSGLAQDVFTEAQPPLFIGKGDRLFAYAYLDPQNPPKAIMLQFHTTDWLHRANWGDDDAIPYGEKGTSKKLLQGALPPVGQWVRLEVEASRLGLKPGARVDGLAFTQFGGTVLWDNAGLVTATVQEDRSAVSLSAWVEQEKAKANSTVPSNVLEIIKLSADKRKPAQTERLREYYIANVYAPAREAFAPLLREIAEPRKQRDELEEAIPSTMIMKELETPRSSFVLKRGEYTLRGEPVEPGVPSVLPPLPARERATRLDLARWLVGRDHPLTARVTVNRFWQQFFGTGLVKSSGDFGSQGQAPSNAELLDWLACEFRDGHPPEQPAWDVKRLVRLIVTSATYRQDSRVTPRPFARDPENRLLARGPRFRLDAEEIRDQALSVSGLLVKRMGGRAVRPYQPEGIWEAVGYTTSNTAKFTQDHGDALYRRSLYTFWKRTAPPPSLLTFDAPSREKYCVRRERTDTPLQALVTMNDPQFVEAARHFGERMIRSGPESAQRLDFGFRTITARYPSTRERATLEAALRKFLTRYQAQPDGTRQLLSVGESKVSPDLAPAELAAYTMVASLLLNLDEALNKN